MRNGRRDSPDAATTPEYVILNGFFILSLPKEIGKWGANGGVRSGSRLLGSFYEDSMI